MVFQPSMYAQHVFCKDLIFTIFFIYYNYHLFSGNLLFKTYGVYSQVHYFNLDISVQQCYETTCKQSKLIVAQDLHIPYPSCENVTRNDTREPYYGIVFPNLNLDYH